MALGHMLVRLHGAPAGGNGSDGQRGCVDRRRKVVRARAKPSRIDTHSGNYRQEQRTHTNQQRDHGALPFSPEGTTEEAYGKPACAAR